jgi:hypothetical protein
VSTFIALAPVPRAVALRYGQGSGCSTWYAGLHFDLLALDLPLCLNIAVRCDHGSFRVLKIETLKCWTEGPGLVARTSGRDAKHVFGKDVRGSTAPWVGQTGESVGTWRAVGVDVFPRCTGEVFVLVHHGHPEVFQLSPGDREVSNSEVTLRLEQAVEQEAVGVGRDLVVIGTGFAGNCAVADAAAELVQLCERRGDLRAVRSAS